MSSKDPSQVVLVRRQLEKIVDGVADAIAQRRGNPDRIYIAALGVILVVIHPLLSSLKKLQCSRHREIPPKIKQQILATELHVPSAFREHFEAIKQLLNHSP